MGLKEKRQKAMNAVTQARALHKKAEDEKREMTPDETKQFDDYMSEYDKLDTEIRQYEKDCERKKKLEDAEKELSKPQNEPIGRQAPGNGEDRANPRATEEYRAAFRRYLRNGASRLSEGEMRALQADSETLGGYIVTPQQFITELLKAVDDQVFVRQFATKYPSGAEGIGVPTLDTDVSDSDWTSELATGNEDSALAFGKRELKPHPLAKRIKVSNKLMRASVFDIESFIRARLAYKFGVTLEKAYMTGTGSQQPLGIFTASANGITTARDVSTGNTTTSIQTDGLIEAKFSIKGQYWPRLRWIFHRDAVKQIRKLKDGQGQYIWQPGVTTTLPDRILDLPYHISEYAPNTFTSGQYVGIIGDFSFYWIVDFMDLVIQRLVELYAETNQTGFIGRMETDGMPVMAEAFARVKLA